MSRYPGAFWRPSGPNRGTRSRTLGVSLHIAVTNGSQDPNTGFCGIENWNADGSGSDPYCQFFNGRYGVMAQYLEFEQIAYGCRDGNGSWATVESFDNLAHATELDPNGLGADETVWDAEQCERVADFLAWASIGPAPEHRIDPAHWTMDSASYGVAPHRAGIAPWRLPGRPSWTMHDGKKCPGNLRVEQGPGICARAAVIRDGVLAGAFGFLPPGRVDLAAALARGSADWFDRASVLDVARACK